MANVSVTNTFVTGTTIDPSQMNTNFTDIVNGTSDGTKDFNISALTCAGLGTFSASITVTGDVTYTGVVKGGSIEYSGSLTPGWMSNLGIDLSAGVFSIVDAGGAALSGSNPGFVTVPSTTGGQMVTLKVTAGGTFNDDSHASSSLTNLGFGITETVDWAEDMPFFLYVVNRANSAIDGSDGSSAFFLARDPRMSTTPSSGDDIGDNATIPVNDSQDVILLMDDVTVANYTSLPCQLIGAIRMQWSTTTDDWTVQALGNSDGLGATQLKKTFSTWFTMPIAQNGAEAGKYLGDNGGTAPTFTTNSWLYRIRDDGSCDVNINFTGDGGIDGIGTDDIQLALPYAQAATGFTTYGGVSGFISNASSQGKIGNFDIATAAAVASIRTAADSGGNLTDNTAIENNDFFGAGARNIRFSGRYRAF